MPIGSETSGGDARVVLSRRTSALLGDVAADGAPRVSIDELAARLGDRTFGAFLLVLGAATFVPSIPGYSGVVGILLMLIAGQLALGRSRPWLPGFIRRASVARTSFRTATGRVRPWLERLERVARPRLPGFTGLAGERMVGAVVFLLALVIALPIPVVGNIPPAIAILALALGLMERDGVLVVLGLLLATAAIVVNSTVCVVAVHEALRLF